MLRMHRTPVGEKEKDKDKGQRVHVVEADEDDEAAQGPGHSSGSKPAIASDIRLILVKLNGLAPGLPVWRATLWKEDSIISN